MSMSMPMSFELSTRTVLWFSQWQTDGPFSYALALAAVVALGLAHEALNARRVAAAASTAAASPRDRALGYALSLVTSYLLMLAVMTYNVGVFAAVVSGMAAGFFVFGTGGGGGASSGAGPSSSSSSRARLLAQQQQQQQQDPCCPAGI